ncbi:potassium channel subfamily K member 1-like protein [Leptotrombidium deliense]|uniref:Potassium channel subfamily K member 1-like protein n=1 Tax=Leptotrombidium deliense TaxID=299467 RepID=A0A443STD5_9ACAR|nr:potassium channel subfamily K member 1-like protein [Leptotrombidium deliense]
MFTDTCGHHESSLQSSLRVESNVDSYSTISDDDERTFSFWTTNTRKLTIVSVIYIAAFGLSAYLLQFIETIEELQIRSQLIQAHRTFLMKNPHIDDKVQLDTDGGHLEPIKDANWDYTSSLLFVSSIVTTIGYGNITPTTYIGKVVSICFAMVGIPSTIFILLSVVKILLKGPVILLESWIVWNLYRLHSVTSLMFIQILHLITVAIVVVFFVFLIPATVFWNLEPNWSFLDSVYYCFITATTIGLGDYVPGRTVNTTFYRICTMAYMFFGVLMMMLLIAVIKRIPIFNFEKILRLEEVKEDLQTIERIRIITGHDCNCEYSSIKVQHVTYGTTV